MRNQNHRKFNVTNRPLFPSIPLSNVVIDNLHIFLRVADVLVDLLIGELRRQDALTKVTSSTFNPDKCKHLDCFQKFVSSLGIPGYNFWVGQNSKQLKWRTLTGPEKLTLFGNINIQELLPNMPEDKAMHIQVL